ncbi:hypothetical protein Trydic_g19210 [Trypoxylus dichotomus]
MHRSRARPTATRQGCQHGNAAEEKDSIGAARRQRVVVRLAIAKKNTKNPRVTRQRKKTAERDEPRKNGELDKDRISNYVRDRIYEETREVSKERVFKDEPSDTVTVPSSIFIPPKIPPPAKATSGITFRISMTTIVAIFDCFFLRSSTADVAYTL